MNDRLFLTTQGVSIRFLSASNCLFYSFPSKSSQLDKQDVIAQAYRDQVLDLNHRYLAYCMHQHLTQDYLCFFAPCHDSSPTLLDLTLPTLLKTKLCCIFLSQNQHFLCFYQDQKLLFCKAFQHDFTPYLQYLKLFFDFTPEEIYCLYSHRNASRIPSPLPLVPLLSLFDPSCGFGLDSIQTPIVLTHFENLNPQKPSSTSSHQTRFYALAFAPLALMILLSLILLGYQSYLTSSLQSLNQHPSSTLSPLKEIETLKKSNQQLLTALSSFSALEQQKLPLLSQILSYLNPNEILFINLDQKLLIKLENPPNLNALIAFLNAMHYRCETTKEGNQITLEISPL